MFADALSNVLGFDYETYLAQEGRGFIAFVVSSASGSNQLVARYRLDEPSAIALMTAAKQLGQPEAFGGYFTPSRLRHAPVKEDVLYIAQRWLDLDEKGRLAIAYHEACHCYRNSNRFQPYPTNSLVFPKVRKVRGHSKYPYDDEFWHDDQWFALLVDKAGSLRCKYPLLFASVTDAVVSALQGDLDAESMTTEEGNFLEATP
jgi:hypothetical protein